MANNLAMLKPGPFQPKGKRDNHQLLRSFQQYRGKMEIFLTALQLQHTGAVAGRAEAGHKGCPTCKQERAIITLIGGDKLVRLFHEVGGVEDGDTFVQAMCKVEVGIKELNSQIRVHKTRKDRGKWDPQVRPGSHEDTESEEDTESMEETESEDETESVEPARVHKLVKKGRVGGNEDTESEEETEAEDDIESTESEEEIEFDDDTESNTRSSTKVVELVRHNAQEKLSIREKAPKVPSSYETDNMFTGEEQQMDKNQAMEVSSAGKILEFGTSVMEEGVDVPTRDASADVSKERNLRVDKKLTAEVSPASKRFGCRTSIIEDVAKVLHSDAEDAEGGFDDECQGGGLRGATHQYF